MIDKLANRSTNEAVRIPICYLPLRSSQKAHVLRAGRESQGITLGV
jgi:hypothetical protein